MDYRQQAAYSGLRPSPLSPVRKALPVGANNTTSWEQRIAAVSTFSGGSIKISRSTSFLQSAALTHFADSLKGAYINYMVRNYCSLFSKFIYLLLLEASYLTEQQNNGANAPLRCFSASLREGKGIRIG